MTATFGETTIDVPPGASNFRDVSMSLSVAPIRQPAAIPSRSRPVRPPTRAPPGAQRHADRDRGRCRADAQPGIGRARQHLPGDGQEHRHHHRYLRPDPGRPGGVGRNPRDDHGDARSGVSQTIPITTGSAGFAVQGSLPLTAIATSTANSSIKSGPVRPGHSRHPRGDGRLHSRLPDDVAAGHGHVCPDGKQHRQHDRLLHRDDQGRERTNHRQLGWTRRLAGAVDPVFYLPGLSTGAIELEVNAAAIGQGTVNVLVQSLSNSAMSATATATLVVGSTTVAPLPGPQVVSVDRYGYHEMPTTLVLTFDQALDAVTADDAKNYVIIGPHGRRIRVKSAVYDPANDTVTLHPSRRISVHYKYKLIVDGAKVGGVANSEGTPLDGTRDGDPGSNYRTTLTCET